MLQVLIKAGITKDMLDHSGRTPLLQAYKHQEFCEHADTCKHHEMVQVSRGCESIASLLLIHSMICAIVEGIAIRMRCSERKVTKSKGFCRRWATAFAQAWRMTCHNDRHNMVGP
jgi:hypothetical protein